MYYSHDQKHMAETLEKTPGKTIKAIEFNEYCTDPREPDNELRILFTDGTELTIYRLSSVFIQKA